MNRKLIVGAAVVALLLAVGSWVLAEWFTPAQDGIQTTGAALIESEFSLVDHTGKPVTNRDFEGKWQLVFFGFTYCPDVCPTTLSIVSAVLEELGDDAKDVAPLFITVDPDRDTPDVMADYVANFDPRIVGLTGAPGQIKAASQAFRVYYAKVEQEEMPDGHTMDHSAFLYLMNPRGEYATHFSQQADVASIVQGIRDFLLGRKVS